MRRRACALICLCTALALSMAAHAAVWTVEHDVVVRREGEASTEVRGPEDVRALAPRSDGGTWLLAAGGMWAITADGDVELHFDPAARGLGSAERLAADPYDGSAWLSTDAPLLLHVARGGALLHGTSLAASAAALATDLAGAAWVVAGPMLIHYGHDGRAIATRPLELARDENATALAIDAIHGRIWLGTTAALYYLSTEDGSTLPTP